MRARDALEVLSSARGTRQLRDAHPRIVLSMTSMFSMVKRNAPSAYSGQDMKTMKKELKPSCSS
jgi:hypothetical protein